MGLTQYVTNAIRGENILDLVILSHPNKLDYCYCNPPIAMSVLFNMLVEKHIQKDFEERKSFSFDKINIDLASSMLASVIWPHSCWHLSIGEVSLSMTVTWTSTLPVSSRHLRPTLLQLYLLFVFEVMRRHTSCSTIRIFNSKKT